MMRRLSALMLSAWLAGPVGAQGVPTVDTQSITQEIRQFQQMLEDFGIQTDQLDTLLQQLDLVQQQLDEFKNMYASLTGPRSIIGMAMGGDLDKLLDSELSDISGLIRQVQTGDWSGLIGGNAGPLRTQMEQVLNEAGFDENTLNEMATGGNEGAARYYDEFVSEMSTFMRGVNDSETLNLCVAISRDVLVGHTYKALIKCHQLFDSEQPAENAA